MFLRMFVFVWRGMNSIGHIGFNIVIVVGGLRVYNIQIDIRTCMFQCVVIWNYSVRRVPRLVVNPSCVRKSTLPQPVTDELYCSSVCWSLIGAL
jgi:hypothetical protein